MDSMIQVIVIVLAIIFSFASLNALVEVLKLFDSTHARRHNNSVPNHVLVDRTDLIDDSIARILNN